MVKRILPHNGATVEPTGSYTKVDGDVIGTGMYVVGAGATLEFQYSVGANETIMLSNRHPGAPYGASHLILDEPFVFQGEVVMGYSAPPPNVTAGQQSTIEMLMSWNKIGWDSYSYHNDMLKLWSGKTVVETLRLMVADPYGITVQTEPTPGGAALISTNTASLHGLPGPHGLMAATPVHLGG